MRIAYIEPFSGASGAMLLGALFSAGLDRESLLTELQNLDVGDVEIGVEPFRQHGAYGLRATIAPASSVHAMEWRNLRRVIESSSLGDLDKAQAIDVISTIADAEATVHGVQIDEALIDPLATFDAISVIVGVRLAGIDQVFAGPVHIGGGVVRTTSGAMPAPDPVTAHVLSRLRVPIAGQFDEEVNAGQMISASGAALLGTLATFERPPFTPFATGYGLGFQQFPWPDMVRITIGETGGAGLRAGSERLLVLETNIDDMNPQFHELLAERLFAAGALDVWSTPIQMKKHRLGQCLSVLARPADQEAMVDLLIEQSTTLGVRVTPCDRIAADRSFESISTRWGDVRIKLKIWKGRVLDISPEYDDCAEIARSNGIGIRDVWNEAYRLGEVYVGRRADSDERLLRLDPLG